jgi:hypothetical protein
MPTVSMKTAGTSTKPIISGRMRRSFTPPAYSPPDPGSEKGGPRRVRPGLRFSLASGYLCTSLMATIFPGPWHIRHCSTVPRTGPEGWMVTPAPRGW